MDEPCEGCETGAEYPRNNLQHGSLNKWGNRRWCVVCKVYHYFLTPCKHYSQDILDEIKRERKDLEDKLNSTAYNILKHW